MELLEVRVFWGQVLLRVEHVGAPWTFTIGQGPSADMFVASDDLPSDAFALVRGADAGWVLTVAPGMNGEIERDGVLESLAAPYVGTCEHTLTTASRAIVGWGGLTFALRFVGAEKRVSRFAWRDVDHDFVLPLVVSFCGHIAAVVTLLLMPYATDSLREEEWRVIEIAELLPRTAPAPIAVAEPPKQMAAPVAGGGMHGRPRPSSRPTVSSDIVGRLSGLVRSIGTLASRGTITEALRDFGTVRGDATGAVRLRGSDALPSRLLASGPGAIGKRDPHGIRDAMLREHVTREPLAVLTPSVSDALSRDAIAKVVSRNRGQIRYCYERELQRDQDLDGRVVLQWIVAATGDVVHAEVRESTLGNGAVESCLVTAIRAWHFPQPAGGGVVTVVYPFVFRAN